MAFRAWLTVLPLLLAVSGCGMPRTVAWSPDGSTLVFRTDDGGLAAYDLERGLKQSIPIDTPTWTQLPAVSPQSSHVAVVDVKSSADEDTIQIRVYSMAGDVVRESSEWRWPAKNGKLKKDVPRPTGALWSGSGRYMLIWYQGGVEAVQRFGRYDWDTDTLLPIEETRPAIDLIQAGMTPLRDDDFGYLATRRNHDGQYDLFLVSWEGWEHQLIGGSRQVTRDLPLFNEPLFPDDKRLRATYAERPPLPGELRMSSRLPITAGRWRLGVLNAQLGRGELAVNTVDRTSSYRFATALADQQEQFADQRVFLRVPIGRSPWFVQARASAEFRPVDVLLELAHTEEQRTLPLGRAVLEGRGFSPAVPAPDGRAVAVTSADETGRVHTTVIDDQGQIVARFQISGPGWDRDLTSDKPADVAQRKPVSRY